MRARGLVLPLLALLAVGVARRRLDVVEVRGRSMAPTLRPGDRLLVARLPARVGDVVLATDPRAPGRELIKRVAAVDAFGVQLRGDNPAASADGRTFGGVAIGAIGWRAILRFWPAERIGRVPAAPEVLVAVDAGGEPACTFPEALIAGG